MPLEIPGELKKYGGFLGKGLIAELAPSILRGALVEMLAHVTVSNACQWVEQNVSLLDKIDPKQRRGLKRLAQAGDLSWLDSTWVINAVKADLPKLASLFLGWVKGKNWLSRQIQNIKTEIAKA